MSNFMKICPQGTELFKADEQTDRHGEVVTVRNYENAHKKL